MTRFSRKSRCGPALFAIVLLLAGCASSEYVVFVTKTSMAVIDADTSPPGISIAYDRTEGVVGPTFRLGHTPSVLAHISSDGRIWTPRVKQAYATGDAARLLAGGEQDPCLPGLGERNADGKGGAPGAPAGGTENQADAYPMFFATQTVAGLKVEFSAVSGAPPIPSGFVFGYRRKEASAIRVARVPAAELPAKDCVPNNGSEHLVYPPVLASIDLRAEAKPPAVGATDTSAPEAALANCQFFATGEAARLVARSGLPALDCNAISVRTFDKYYRARQELQEEGLRTLGCYLKLRPDQRPAVWKDVTRLDLWGELSEEERDPKSKRHPEQVALSWLDKSKAGGEAGQRALASADTVYAKSVGTAGSLGGFEEGRVRAMQAHRKLVCDLAAAK